MICKLAHIYGIYAIYGGVISIESVYCPHNTSIALNENLSKLCHACFELNGDYLIGTRFVSDQS
jgi:hypothetical protein